MDEKLVKEYRSGGMNTTPITLEYFYNGEDLIGFSIQEGDAAAVNYYYGKTNNGEIRFIYDANGNIVTTYLYDAWGNPIPTDESSDSEVGEINPFRYKSYYYDSETRLYYLRSRSYDPAVGRFLNADSTDYLGATGTVLSFNLFAYCENTPITYNDKTGESITVACILIFGVIGVATGGYAGYKLAQYYNVKKSDTWKYVLGGIVIGGAAGALLGWGVGGVATVVAAKSASISLFAGRVATNGTMIIQLLKKFYEKTKTPMNLKQVKQLITLCQRFGIEIHAKLGDLVNVINHKTWNGIPHIHVGDSRIHVALTEEAVKYIREILGI